jgi:hypothetical protein
MTDPSAAQRGTLPYHRMLRAYPRRFRQVYGEELITTMLDAAGQGQRTPTAREAFDLITGGLRYRFALPGATAHRLVAALVAALFGLGLCAITAEAVWAVADPPLPASTIDAVTATALPGHAAEHLNQSRPGFPWLGTDMNGDLDTGLGGRGPSPSAWRAGIDTGAAGLDADGIDRELAQARQRLTHAGWQVTDAPGTSSETQFWAHRHGIYIKIVALRKPESEPSTSLQIEAHRDAQAAVIPGALAALVVGAAIGWLTAATVLRRYRQCARGRRVAVAAVGIMGQVLVLPGVVICSGLLFAPMIRDGLDPRNFASFWLGFLFTTVATVPGMACLAVATALACLSTSTPVRPPATV